MSVKTRSPAGRGHAARKTVRVSTPGRGPAARGGAESAATASPARSQNAATRPTLKPWVVSRRFCVVERLGMWVTSIRAIVCVGADT